MKSETIERNSRGEDYWNYAPVGDPFYPYSGLRLYSIWTNMEIRGDRRSEEVVRGSRSDGRAHACASLGKVRSWVHRCAKGDIQQHNKVK